MEEIGQFCEAFQNAADIAGPCLAAFAIASLAYWDDLSEFSFVNRAMFQVVFPESGTDTVYVRYGFMGADFDESSATIGAQSPGAGVNFPMSFDGVGAVSNGVTIAYHFGTGSNPLSADTDGDGLDDAAEASIGSSPLIPFSIRGKNPLDATARAYIDANVDAEFRDFAWMIAKHESRNSRTDQFYNQFNSSGKTRELPNWGTPHGWGIAQIDKGDNGDTTAEVYDWHVNVASMNDALRNKRNRYQEIIRLYRNSYQNDPTTHWVEPDNVATNVNGIIVSAQQWAIMTLYNGAAGTHALPFAGHLTEHTPIHFDPITSKWYLYTNINDYVPMVLRDSVLTEVE